MSKVEYAQGFNQGFQDATSRFAVMINLLAASFLIRIILQHPKIQERINDATRFNLADDLMYSADILAFFLTAFIAAVVHGVPAFIIS